MQFDWGNPYPSTAKPFFARNAVATSHPLAAQAGLQMLLAGGNAVDAALATAAMLTVVEPVSCGFGGDAYAIVWDGHTLHGLNATGVAPRAWSLDFFRARHGTDATGLAQQPMRGWDSVTVPGVVSAWAEMHRRFGTLPLADILEPAAVIAERGHLIAPAVARKWTELAPVLEQQPGFAQTFMPHGRAPHMGEKFHSPGHAYTLRLLGREGAAAFYEGELAERMVAFARETGGALDLTDLREHRAEWVDTISRDYRGYTVHELPPNGQGIAALIALGILERFDLRAWPVDSAQSQHLQIEAMKLAFSDVYELVGDPRCMTVSPAEMLDDAYLDARAALIDPHRAGSPAPGLPKPGGTTQISTADERGMMVSLIQSNYRGFGSGVVVPATGISFQNRGAGFSMDPKSVNVVRAGKRPFHTIMPGFLMRDGNPVMSFGVVGAEVQPQAHVQTLVRMLDYGQQPQAACDAPRWKLNRDFTLDVESAVNPGVLRDLQEMGHTLKPHGDQHVDFGSGQFISRLSDNPDHGYVVATDGRRDGRAVGY
ncbi:gamma-glutamyltransferase family protein [Paraburkholderia sediminicola]|uniref:Gamma-glutamyltransferase family protein n=1 Tax=Paraburkholderia rhynchosiae TaxID=487049 RepID=A0ACC7NHQ9_9BURK